MLDPIVVVGAGAAGMAAALAAARVGTSVILLETTSAPGGIVARALIHTIGGLFDASGYCLNEGIPEELVRRLLTYAPSARRRRIGSLWTLAVPPEAYAAETQKWLAEDRRIELITDVRESIYLSEGRSVSGVRIIGDDGSDTTRRVRAVVDCTGNANAIRAIDATKVEGSPDETLAGCIVRLRRVAHGALAFPNSVSLRRAVVAAVNAGRLPTECAHTWFDTGQQEDEVFVKLSVTHRQSEAGLDRRMRTAIAQLLAFLHTQPHFGSADLTTVGEMANRSGYRAVGEYRLTAEDIRARRSFPDRACRASWPIELWDPVRGVMLESVRDGGAFDIPVRALKVAGMENVWAAGKCLSADPLAQASVRIAGCCWATGQAAGVAAAGATALSHRPAPTTSGGLA